MPPYDRDDLPALVQRLTSQVSFFGGGRQVMTEYEQLTSEALDCAKHGDLDEAKHRLRLRDRPKFYDISDCKKQYKAAMEETRAAREAGA